LDFKDYSGAAAAWNFAGRCLQQKGYAPTTVAVFEFKFLVGGRPNPSITERDLEIRIFLPAERSPCDGYSFTSAASQMMRQQQASRPGGVLLLQLPTLENFQQLQVLFK